MNFKSSWVVRAVFFVTIIDKISFNAKYFSDIFQANMDCENGLIEISSEGLAKLSFKVDNLTSVYWVVASQDND